MLSGWSRPASSNQFAKAFKAVQQQKKEKHQPVVSQPGAAAATTSTRTAPPPSSAASGSATLAKQVRMSANSSLQRPRPQSFAAVGGAAGSSISTPSVPATSSSSAAVAAAAPCPAAVVAALAGPTVTAPAGVAAPGAPPAGAACAVRTVTAPATVFIAGTSPPAVGEIAAERTGTSLLAAAGPAVSRPGAHPSAFQPNQPQLPSPALAVPSATNWSSNSSGRALPYAPQLNQPQLPTPALAVPSGTDWTGSSGRASHGTARGGSPGRLKAQLYGRTPDSDSSSSSGLESDHGRWTGAGWGEMLAGFGWIFIHIRHPCLP